ncbi:glycosyl hydrolase family 88 [Clostridium sp. MCC353]|uniref:glycoside hydrolase family 88 protein n=1 Tax=Clostridium sp. MCC353 TaxID=2592646 RepID=UPI001C011901|nr:glycoside hydrolase family 88 protein [Clostridium sp. MCC353]MBT9778155.1 glycosyl hydrolase family 88 [Clostridium sp. MCC353]
MRYGIDDETLTWAEGIWGKLEKKLEAECRRLGPMMPYVPVNGKYEDMGKKELTAWTNGFYSGILWQMYHATGKECYKDAAVGIEERLDGAFSEYTKLDHDLGFLWLHTAVADYRLTGNEKSRARGLHAAGILAGRYNPNGKFIKAWNGPREGIAIVDCLMNLPLLYWASEELGDRACRQIAVNHTDMALRYICRPDGSCNHLVEFDALTGEYKGNPGGQGYESGSSWSRGQSWAVYGMSLAYRYTGNEAFLDAAKRTAHYFCANLALNGYIPLIDFRAPAQPVYYDTTAGVCGACGLLELSEHVSPLEKDLYVKSAVRCLKAAADGFCNWNPETDSILGHGSARYDREYDREVPIIYGDYFLTEGILRLLDKDFLIW